MSHVHRCFLYGSLLHNVVSLINPHLCHFKLEKKYCRNYMAVDKLQGQRVRPTKKMYLSVLSFFKLEQHRQGETLHLDGL